MACCLTSNPQTDTKPEVAGKKEVIILTKHDLLDKSELEKVKKTLSKLEKDINVTSIYDIESMEKMYNLLI